jgi:hypothetical protein
VSRRIAAVAAVACVSGSTRRQAYAVVAPMRLIPDGEARIW